MLLSEEEFIGDLWAAVLSYFLLIFKLEFKCSPSSTQKLEDVEWGDENAEQVDDAEECVDKITFAEDD